MLPTTAATQQAGGIGRDHVKVIRDFIAHLPRSTDDATVARAEEQLAGFASVMRPDELRACADRLAAHLNPDGKLDQEDRARRRSFHLGEQGVDKMSKISGLIDPEFRAYLEAVFAKLAKPGSCDPDDSTPETDRRSAGQRQHDAAKAMCRITISSGKLGQHRGLPVTVIATVTLRDLQNQTGTAATGGGSMLPIKDLIRMAADTNHYLAVFDDDGAPLYLGRSKRIASPEQRIVLHAKDRGCTFPSCGKPGYLCQVHHLDEWAAKRGRTDIDVLTFACDVHHGLIGDNETQWQTVGNRHGRTQWVPPAHVDPLRQPRVNHFHHPDEHLTGEPPPG